MIPRSGYKLPFARTSPRLSARTALRLSARAALRLSARTSPRLSALLGTTPQLWLDLQHGYDLYQALNSKEAVRIQKTIQPIATAEGYRAMSHDNSAFAEAALPLASETWPASSSETAPPAGRPRRRRT